MIFHCLGMECACLLHLLCISVRLHAFARSEHGNLASTACYLYEIYTRMRDASKCHFLEFQLLYLELYGMFVKVWNCCILLEFQLLRSHRACISILMGLLSILSLMRVAFFLRGPCVSHILCEDVQKRLKSCVAFIQLERFIC